MEEKKPDLTLLQQKIIVYLDEIRVVLPGTQALLGFQLVAAFSFGFEKIDLMFKYFHILSLILISFSVILLLAPAAFHRIAEHGKDSHRLHKLTSKMIIVAMATLGIGVAVDLFVVVSVILQSTFIGIVVSLVITSLLVFAWYVYPYSKRLKIQDIPLNPQNFLQGGGLNKI